MQTGEETMKISKQYKQNNRCFAEYKEPKPMNTYNIKKDGDDCKECGMMAVLKTEECPALERRTRNTFEDYLEDRFSLQYVGLDDDMPECYEDWLVDLDVNELITFANDYAELRLLEKRKKVKP